MVTGTKATGATEHPLRGAVVRSRSIAFVARGVCDTEPVNIDALWRVLHRVLLVMTIGVLGLLLGLGPRPDRGDSAYGLLLLLVVAVPVAALLWRIPPERRKALVLLPRRRPLLGATAGSLVVVAFLVLCWTVFNAVSPGTLSPLSLALLGVAVAGIAALLHRLTSTK
jgi:hypothetical protein